jgi:L-threonylcarbamoyladenylate synthase
MLPGVPEENQRVLSPKGDLKEAAAALFRSLRSFNTDDIDQILAEEFPKEGLGRAINDRLKRASAS